MKELMKDLVTDVCLRIADLYINHGIMKLICCHTDAFAFMWKPVGEDGNEAFRSPPWLINEYRDV